MKTNKILVLGHKGKTGRKVLAGLQSKGTDARGASRSTNPSFDWQQPETWPAALQGINNVYLNYPFNLAAPGAIEVVTQFAETAVKAGVKRIVMLSGRGEREAETAEEAVRQISPEWTVLRSDWFFQNFSENFLLEPIQYGEVVLPKAEIRLPFIDTNDIAAIAVEALTTDVHLGKTYELTGPELLTLPETVDIISEATGREITFTGVSLEEYMTMLAPYGLPQEELDLVQYLFGVILDGRNSMLTGDVETILGRKPKSFSAFAAATAKSGIWKAKELAK